MIKYLLILAITFLVACGNKSALPVIDAETQCALDGGTWRTAMAEEVDPGLMVAQIGLCECTPIQVGEGLLCEEALYIEF
jgi:hypothetical protein